MILRNITCCSGGLHSKENHVRHTSVWVSAAIDIGKADESEGGQIIDYTVRLPQ